MTRGWTFARFDIVNLATQPRQIAAAFLFVVVIAAVSPFPALAVPAAGIMVSLLAATTFAYDERGRLDTLYATLPASRAAVVVSRYLTTLVLWVAVTVVAVAATLAATVLRGGVVDAELFVAMLVIGFGTVALAVSLQLPIFFALGYTRGRPVRFVPIAIIAGGGWIAGQLGLLPDTVPEISAAALAGAITAGVGLVLLVASARTSAVLYARRQF